MQSISVPQPTSHRIARITGGLFTAALVAVAMVGCAGDGAGSNSDGESTQKAASDLPSYYPSNYTDIIDASKAEGGTLVMYTTSPEEQWAPIYDGFKKKYPWVKDIQNTDLSSDAVFQRQLSEMATGSAPADLLISAGSAAWADYASKPDRVLSYDSPEVPKLPDFAEPLPSVYAVSIDPLVLAYNSQLVDNPPKSLSDVASLVSANPKKFKGKVTTYDTQGSFGFAAYYAYVDASSDAWDILDQIIPMIHPESSSGTMVEKILSGEYLIGLDVSSSFIYKSAETSGGLIKYAYPTDGTVVITRGMAIMPKAPHSATAKLFVDYVLSAEGQSAVAQGGLHSYRDGIDVPKGSHTYQEVEKLAGKSGIIQIPYEQVSDADVNEFHQKWNAAAK